MAAMMTMTRRVGKYELGRTIGEGTFAKVKFAINTETGESVAVKVLAKTTILKHRMVDQIKREISIMKIVRHPFIVRLHEVLASRTKIYIILEFVPGGELFDKIVHKGKFSEMESRKYFQQLVDAISHCHRKGVYHRDLKPENLLLDARENLKVSDFGLSALPQEGVKLLHTTCGTPNYVAPEVLNGQGYDGAAADIWSCGVILYVLLAGFLPFEEITLATLYQKINSAAFSCPFWFSPDAKSLIERLLDPNPKTRITIEEIRNDPWFQVNYIPARQNAEEEVNLDDVRAAFDDIEDHYVTEQSRHMDRGPLIMNAFEMITLSQGLNLSALFDRRQTRLEGVSSNRRGPFAVVLEIYEVAPSLFMVDVRKAAGDTLEYHKFYKSFCAKLDNIIWKPKEHLAHPSLLKAMSS
ncbi:CBL-interacting serine/threonine-protein kinase 24-like isoform X2 [Amaranthus tricolor]|uniref:CBL-interacting serine/threonine-protein kinase 24-like isoform X2 n=1 Tax=Amaranthus tricolor TaxID=29722 RepID=UPI00258E85B3|nr:CBL-interacting serine/threonine-protein kinase 24-like isoform X2 [Amaranthus tricolor]